MFSEHFETELDVVDIQTQRVDKFGEHFVYITLVKRWLAVAISGCFQ